MLEAESWSMHALSSQQRGSRPSCFAANSAWNSRILDHFAGGSSRHEWLRKASHSPAPTFSVFAKSPESCELAMSASDRLERRMQYSRSCAARIATIASPLTIVCTAAAADEARDLAPKPPRAPWMARRAAGVSARAMAAGTAPTTIMGVPSRSAKGPSMIGIESSVNSIPPMIVSSRTQSHR